MRTITVLAAVTLLAGCGGGGGTDNTAPAAQAPTVSAPSTEQVAADKQVSTSMLRDYATKRAADGHALYQADQSQIVIINARKGTTGGSAQRDQLLAAVQTRAEQIAFDVENYARAIVVTRSFDKSAFSQVFADLRASELSYYAIPINGPVTEYTMSFNSGEAFAVNGIYDDVVARLRSTGVVN